VVGGTTTALSVLTGLGYPALGKVNSSHPTCNHEQKWAVVQAGLQRAGIIDFGLGIGEKSEVSAPGEQPILHEDTNKAFLLDEVSGGIGDGDSFNNLFSAPPHVATSPSNQSSDYHRAYPPHPPLSRRGEAGSENFTSTDPLQLVAAVGDPMQVAVAGMAIAASRTCGVLLAGGTQMLAVYALMQAIADQFTLEWQPAQIVVGTTRWVAQDSSGDTVGLAKAIGSVPLLATELSFTDSRFAQLRAYEQGYVKEGVGAGGAAIAAHLYQGWNQVQLLQAIEALVDRT
jgi:NaMN:DMB phosphoribosyltransferase